MVSLDKLKLRLKAYSEKHGRPYNQAMQALLLERTMEWGAKTLFPRRLGRHAT